MIADEFCRLPKDLQRHIYSLALHNPFRKTTLVKKWIGRWSISEVRETPFTSNGSYFRICAIWVLERHKLILGSIQIERGSIDNNTLEVVMKFDYCLCCGEKYPISDESIVDYIPELIATYRGRELKLTEEFTKLRQFV